MMTNVYVLEWGNGNVDVFADAADAVACYAEQAAQNRDDGEMAGFVANEGQVMSLEDAVETANFHGGAWSEKAQALRG